MSESEFVLGHLALEPCCDCTRNPAAHGPHTHRISTDPPRAPHRSCCCCSEDGVCDRAHRHCKAFRYRARRALNAASKRANLHTAEHTTDRRAPPKKIVAHAHAPSTSTRPAPRRAAAAADDPRGWMKEDDEAASAASSASTTAERPSSHSHDAMLALLELARENLVATGGEQCEDEDGDREGHLVPSSTLAHEAHHEEPLQSSWARASPSESRERSPSIPCSTTSSAAAREPSVDSLDSTWSSLTTPRQETCEAPAADASASSRLGIIAYGQQQNKFPNIKQHMMTLAKAGVVLLHDESIIQPATVDAQS